MTIAANPSSSAIQTAINATADGGTVTVPAGSGTWNSAITMSGKAVKIEGAGIGSTLITMASGGSFSMSGASAGGNVGMLGGMTFSGSAGQEWLGISSSYKFRLHHLAMPDMGENRSMVITGTYGLLDHIAFTTVSGRNVINVLGCPQGSGPSGRWTAASLAWEDENFVFIEDCTYSSTNCVTGLGVFDGSMGSKIVFRYNTVTNWQSYVHGYDSATESALQTCIYNNLFDMAKSNCNIDRMIFIRGGTGVSHHNTMHLTDAYNNYSPRMLSLYYYRSTTSQQGSICNGSAGVDQNLPGMSGYM